MKALVAALLLAFASVGLAGEASLTVTCPANSSSSTGTIFPSGFYTSAGTGSRKAAIFVASAATSLCSRPNDCVTGASGNTFTVPANVPVVDEFSRGQMYCISQSASTTTLSVLVR